MIIEKEVPLHEKTWFGTGGKARFFAQPTSAEQFCQAVSFAHRHGIEYVVIGEGTNLLVSDQGFNGLVIKPALKRVSIELNSITAGAGVSFDTLIDVALDAGLTGIEEFSGIPGSVGGAVFMNIHYFEFLLQTFVKEGVVVDNEGNLKKVSADWFEFGYNYSRLHAKEYFLIEVTFSLRMSTEIEVAFARGRRKEIIRHRMRKYPYQRTCGSFFRSFSQEEMDLMIKEPRLPFVGYYLDVLGAKGTARWGKAKVSHQHANMIVTEPGATSHEVIELARMLQTMVYNSYGVVPQPECQFVGFTKPPLFPQKFA